MNRYQTAISENRRAAGKLYMAMLQCAAEEKRTLPAESSAWYEKRLNDIAGYDMESATATIGQVAEVAAIVGEIAQQSAEWIKYFSEIPRDAKPDAPDAPPSPTLPGSTAADAPPDTGAADKPPAGGASDTAAS